MITVAQRHKLDIGFLSLDQEKAFDRVDHHCLFKTLEAFGFGTHFISLVKLLYNDIYSMLRINGSLTRPFPLTKGIRQGCPLSGLLYSISNEPLLAMLRKQLCGFGVPGFSEVAQWHFSTVWYGTVRFSTVDFWGVSYRSVPLTVTVHVPYHYQNVMCKLCWSLIGRREFSLLCHWTCDTRPNIDPLDLNQHSRRRIGCTFLY